MPDVSYIDYYKDLITRCKDCKERIFEYGRKNIQSLDNLSDSIYREIFYESSNNIESIVYANINYGNNKIHDLLYLYERLHE